MKKSIYIVILSLVGLGSCASQKKLQNKPPFVVEDASFQKLGVNKEDSNFGTAIKIHVNVFNTDTITFKDLYFRGKISEAITETIAGKIYITAKFMHQNFEKPDIIMHADPRKEVGNQLPLPKKDKKTDFPFELRDDEAVISYIENHSKKVKFTKIIGVKEK